MRTSEPTNRRVKGVVISSTTTTTSSSTSGSSNVISSESTVTTKKKQQQQLHMENQKLLSKKKQQPNNNTKIQLNKMAPYVLQGIHFFIKHGSLWKLILIPFIWTLLFVIVLFSIFIPFLFIPQGIGLSTIMTPFLGFPLAFILSLIEMLILLMLLSIILLLPVTDRLFDRVLILRGHSALVESDRKNACCGCCSIVGIAHLIISILTLPINFIPGVGTVLWLFINGRLYTWDKHSHYHIELKGRNFNTQRQFVANNWYSHHIFGMQAMALEMIPFASVFFIFTNTVSAALWAADMEDKLLLEQQQITDQQHDASELQQVQAQQQPPNYQSQNTSTIAPQKTSTLFPTNRTTMSVAQTGVSTPTTTKTTK